MKIKPEHLTHIWQTLEPLDTEFHRSRCKAAGFSDKRYRWDMLRHAGLMGWLCDTLYPYLNDDHIDTALRNVIQPL